MAVTRLKRKARKNKTVVNQNKTMMKNNSRRVTIPSPYKGVSGEIIEEEQN